MTNCKRFIQSLNCIAFFFAQILLFLLAYQIQPAFASDCGSPTDIQAALSPETTVTTKGGDIAFQGVAFQRKVDRCRSNRDCDFKYNFN